MLKILRKKGVAKKILWVIAVIIIISFGFFGTAYLLTDNAQAGYAGKLFGRKIPFDEFSSAFQHVRIQALMQFGDKFEEIAQFLNLEAETWDRLILLYEAKKKGIKITDQEVIQTIEQYPFFQRDGRFDPLLYNDILRYVFRMQARDFEEGVRENIRIIKLSNQATFGLTVSDQEIFAAYKKQNEKVQISYVFLSSDSFKNEISPDEKTLQKYYDDNKIEFLVPPSIDIEYISLDLPPQKDEEKGQTSTEKAVEKTAEKNSATDKAKQDLKKKAEDIFQDLLANPDMREIAKKYALKVQTSGFFGKEQPNLAPGWSYDFLNKLFQLEQGYIHEPLETHQGILVAKIKEKKDTYVPEYKEAKEQVRESVVAKEAKSIARQKAEETLKTIKEEWARATLKEFPTIAKNLGLEIYQTPVFIRGQYLPKIGISGDFQEAAFQLTEENSISETVETANGYCILHLDTYVPTDEESYAKEKETLRASLLKERETQAFNDFLSRLRVKAELTGHIPQKDSQI
jgi:peptidyl-prolyl cis-trans isomerase D